jgi:hypothetical protein
MRALVAVLCVLMPVAINAANGARLEIEQNTDILNECKNPGFRGISVEIMPEPQYSPDLSSFIVSGFICKRVGNYFCNITGRLQVDFHLHTPLACF